MLTDLADGIRRLQKLNKDMSELELREEALNLRQLLVDAREALSAKDTEIQALKDKIDRIESGDACPLCRAGRLSITAINEHPVFGVFGHQEHTLKCSKCGHTETRKVDPK
ncbi:hypothetical protein D1114_01805 [Cereibacter sphaeroides]|uniref:Uncharacterized protein n=2 Tax=Cereibacter sphaeroides TaxID=1063 RepID=A0AAX1URS6_CERSP|nr:hypothetical protein D1114_01805 [Cereibacter sphaeroides]